jgi:hypothetical protein
VNEGVATSAKSSFWAFARASPDRGERLALLLGVLLAQAVLQLAVLAVEACLPLAVEQVRHHADDARRRRDVHVGCEYSGAIFDAVCCFDGRRAADQQRQVEAASLHLARDVDHLVERRRDQAREPDDVRPSAIAVSRILSAGTITPRSITS